MTDPKVQSTAKAEVSADDIRAVKFNRVIGRGYEQQEVDAFVDKCAAWIDWFTLQLGNAQRELARLGQQVADSGGEQVQQAIQVLTNAQQTADTTVRQADQYSLRVMSEAKQLYEEARLRTASLEQEAEVTAKGLTEDAAVRAERLQRDSTEQADALLRSTQERAAALERDAQLRAEKLLKDAAEQAAAVDAQTKDRMQELGESTAARQAELDKQTAYLRTLRDSSRIQMQKFLEGMLDHLSDEYGRADPAAAHAAADGKANGNGSAASRRLVGRPKRSARRSYRTIPSAQVVSGAAVPQQRPADRS
jgi:DivIVA domain-containing protein